MEVGQGPNVGCSAKGKKNATEQTGVTVKLSEVSCSNLELTNSYPQLSFRAVSLSFQGKIYG
jgi:hypothetical protein